MSKKSWYQIKSMSDDVVTISIHDEIGYWGISAKDFITELMQYPDAKTINLSIHSPGGEMIDGFAIYNAIKAHTATVHGHVEGIAASMASVILMAADTISMPENAFIMIHNPSGGAWGESDDLRHMADLMDKFKASAMTIYQNKTGLPDDELSAMLDAETWLDGHEAMAKGFVDTVTDAIEVAAKASAFNKHFKSMPIDNDSNIDGIKTIKDFERFLRESGGISRGLATALSSRAKVLFQGDPEPKINTTVLDLDIALSQFKIPKPL
jgi:ATP-dependent Clp endopeptidase proteolytic subunit ClpP